VNIIRVRNFGIPYEFDVDDKTYEEIREFDVYGADPFSGKNRTPIATIRVTGYNTKMDDIEKVLRDGFLKEKVNEY
jgi:hypothetical protein